MKLHLNGKYIGSRPIDLNSPTDIHEEIWHLPVSGVFPRNTLMVEFAFEKMRGSDLPTAAVLKSSELMVKGIPHFASMPRLDMFANTGFPFTRVADLSETMIVLPAAPQPEDVSLYLTMLSFMSAQTGYPALRATVALGNEVPVADNKDVLVIAAGGKLPLYRDWSKSMPVQADGDRLRLAANWFSDIVSRKDRKIVDVLLQSDNQIDGLVQGLRFANPQ